MSGRVWTDEEKEFLENNYGSMSAKQLAKKLNRTAYSIKHMIINMGINGATNSGLYTVSQLAEILQVTGKTIRTAWIPKYRLKAKKISISIVGNKGFYLMEQKDIMKWLKDNQHRFDASKIEYMALGEEPVWLRDKRRRDLNKELINHNKRWTDEEIKTMLMYYRQGKTLEEISKKLGRTGGATRAKFDKVCNDNDKK